MAYRTFVRDYTVTSRQQTTDCDTPDPRGDPSATNAPHIKLLSFILSGDRSYMTRGIIHNICAHSMRTRAHLASGRSQLAPPLCAHRRAGSLRSTLTDTHTARARSRSCVFATSVGSTYYLPSRHALQHAPSGLTVTRSAQLTHVPEHHRGISCQHQPRHTPELGVPCGATSACSLIR